MPGPITVNAAFVVPAAELTWRFSRSSGPGGQGVNTTDSRVELSYDVARAPSMPDRLRARSLERLSDRLVDGVLTVTASEHRSQLRNREAAQARLGALLAQAVAAPKRTRRATRPSRSAVQRRLDEKRRRGQQKLARRPPYE